MKKAPVIHPFLIAILPVIAVYSYNTGIIPAIQLLYPLIATIALAFIVLSAIRFMLKDWLLAGLMTSPLLLILLTYGRFYEYMSSYLAVFSYHALIKVFICYLVLIIYLTYCYLLILKSERVIRANINNFLNIVTVVLLVFNLGNMVYLHAHEPLVSVEQLKPVSSAAYKPDIYYIILDQYASLAEMKDVLGYDNSAFAQRLEAKGFFVARQSKTRFVTTDMSLASSLNLGNVKIQHDNATSVDSALVVHLDKTDSDRDDYANKMIHYNLAARTLKQFGYKYINFGNWAIGTQYNKLADKNIKCFGFRPDNELADILIWDSILRLIFIPRQFFRAALLYEFDGLSKVPQEESPKFVFAHILCPHLPYVFGSNGEEISFKDSRKTEEKALYTGQYIFVTKKVEQLVDDLLSKSKTPPVIIIQSDHGSKLDLPYVHNVFNAIYLPKGGNKILTNTTAPHNIFRLIFNYYFGQSLPILPD
jgi:hypothetical protein